MKFNQSSDSECPPDQEGKLLDTGNSKMIQLLNTPLARPAAQDLAADNDLVNSALKGDEAARRAFAERMRCIPRFIHMRSRNRGFKREELADLAQEVFASVWKRLPSYRGEARLETWVHTFCVHALGNAVRKRSRRPLEVDSAHLLEYPSQEDSPDDRRLAPLLDALSNLSPDHQEIIRLHAMQSMPYCDIAAQIGCSERAARARYQRAIRELRSHLNPQPPEPA